ncbi:copper resistance protein NlpE N-terminal domain-containing protein [Methylomonas sp. LL1]|uniref:copper resistance protein NlpE n=1 Tax=Methylomonas sp. LL1 TaxID=2785785 RepID=UPI0018C3C6D8|nr:copper resistance protein NlpE [Methylomonas sp. LL1]QPK62696.1 copper resistance protein NlpE N-terminal domain-containing protein [Methylomonas sp. LL1]
MHTLNKKITKNVALTVFGALFLTCNPAWAKSDMQLQEEALKAREMRHQDGMGHSMHQKSEDSSGGFRGVFYGYLPCKEEGCDGIKQTLSLKPRNNYLLVTQFTKEFSMREYYEKGKYDWDDKTHILTLTPSKEGAAKRLYTIQDEGALVTLDSDGKPMSGDQEDYTLSRSDRGKTRQVHIH